MSQKSSILSDYFGKVFLNEMRGISFEVRAWAKIIKDVVDSEYKKYWDDYNKRMMSQRLSYNVPSRNRSYFGGYQGRRWDDFDDIEGFYQMVSRGQTQHDISIEDLAVMSQDEMNTIVDSIMKYHKLTYDQVIDLGPSDVVKLYNQTLDQQNL